MTLPATRTRDGNVKGAPTRYVRGHGHRRRLSETEFAYEDRGHQTPCRIWQRSLGGGGYGYRWVNGRSRRVHVLEWEKIYGPVPEGFELDHLCGQRDCGEVTHLRLATRAGNARAGAGAKLTAEQVAQIRGMKGSASQRAIGVQFGVSRATIADIYAGRTWVAA